MQRLDNSEAEIQRGHDERVRLMEQCGMKHEEMKVKKKEAEVRRNSQSELSKAVRSDFENVAKKSRSVGLDREGERKIFQSCFRKTTEEEKREAVGREAIRDGVVGVGAAERRVQHLKHGVEESAHA